MEATRQILNQKLFNNDINIVSLIMDFVTEKCKSCNEVNFTNDLQEVCIPNSYTTDCGKHTKGDKWVNYCLTCVEEKCCKNCEDVLCADCDNEYVCSAEHCNNKFCNDCSGPEMLWCSGCEGRFCCKKVYKTIGPDEDYRYSCEGCMEVIYPRY